MARGRGGRRTRTRANGAPVAGAAEARRYFADNLCGQSNDGPFVFVFDNFETIREQAELYHFVSNSIRLPNKALISTRTRDFNLDPPKWLLCNRVLME